MSVAEKGNIGRKRGPQFDRFQLHFISALPSRKQPLMYLSASYSYEPRHEISKNVVFATSKGSDQPAHTRSLIRAFASRLNIL